MTELAENPQDSFDLQRLVGGAVCLGCGNSKILELSTHGVFSGGKYGLGRLPLGSHLGRRRSAGTSRIDRL